MATIDGYAWTTIGDGSIDADSPFDDTLSTDIRDNVENLMRWLGKDYLSGAAANHDHDGVNSALVGGASGGSAIAVYPYKGTGYSVRFDSVRMKPEWCFFGHIMINGGAPTTEPIYVKTSGMGTGLNSHRFSDDTYADHGADIFYYGGVGMDGASAALNTSTNYYDRLMLASASGLISCGGYTGTGSSQSITTPGFQPTFVFIVRRATNGATCLKLSDYGSTNSKQLDSGAFSSTGITSLDANGFTVGTNTNCNASGVTYDYLALKAGALNGERIAKITWAGNNVDGRAVTGAGFRAQAALVFRTDVTTNNGDWFQTSNMIRLGAQRFGQAVQDGLHSFDADGITVDVNLNATGSNYTAFLFLGGTRTGPF